MEKSKKTYGKIFTFIFTLFITIDIIAILLDKATGGNNTKEILTIGAICILLFIVVIILVIIIIYIYLWIKKGIHNVRKCDDELFDEIDQYKKQLEECNENYLDQIKIINWYYQRDGKVDQLVHNHQLGRLFKRMDFLMVRKNLFDDLTTCFCSLGISVLASFVFKFLDSDESSNWILSFVVTAAVIVIFFIIVLLKYSERGKSGSYIYLIEEYERKLLAKKINSAEKEILIDNNDEKLLLTKHTAIIALVDLRKKTFGSRKKQLLEEDIQCIQQLNLCMENYKGCYMKEININDKKGYLIYDKKKGKSNNYTGQNNLKTEEFSILYEILSKNKLIKKYF